MRSQVCCNGFVPGRSPHCLPQVLQLGQGLLVVIPVLTVVLQDKVLKHKEEVMEQEKEVLKNIRSEESSTGEESPGIRGGKSPKT
jgi:hypothetical protein